MDAGLSSAVELRPEEGMAIEKLLAA